MNLDANIDLEGAHTNGALRDTIPCNRKAHNTKSIRSVGYNNGDRCSVYVPSATGDDNGILTCNSITEKRETHDTYIGISEMSITVGNADGPIT